MVFSPERKETFWLEDQKFSFGHVCLKSLLNFLVEISSRQLVTWVTYIENKTGEDKLMYDSMENKWYLGFPGGASGKEPSSQCKRHEMQVQSLDWKIPWRRAWQPTPVYLPRESHGQRSPMGRRQSIVLQRVKHD